MGGRFDEVPNVWNSLLRSIRTPITERHSLFPASYIRILMSLPCGPLCPDIPGEGTGLPCFA
uniref:Uncharacterized protein n=1 Tax=mine drainage metagenome TaxID=410659 RepID=E6QJM9_9ZZZZ